MVIVNRQTHLHTQKNIDTHRLCERYMTQQISFLFLTDVNSFAREPPSPAISVIVKTTTANIGKNSVVSVVFNVKLSVIDASSHKFHSTARETKYCKRFERAHATS